MSTMPLTQHPTTRRVLMVEDDAATAELMRRSLDSAGYIPVLATTVEEGLKVLHQNDCEAPLAMLLDYQLPDGEPWLLADEARLAMPDLPVVFVTGSMDEKLAGEAVRRGFADYVRKHAGFWNELPAVIERVSQLRQIKGRLDETNELMRAIVEHSTDLIAVCRPDGLIVYLSPVCQQLLGCSEEQLVGHGWQEIVTEVDRPQLETAIARMGEAPEQKLTLSCQRRDGLPLWAEIRIAPLGVGPEPMVVLTLHDVTEQRWHEQQMQASLREKEVLLREIYHRVKNNLQVIQSLLKMQGRSMAKGDARKAIESTAQRVYAMALVHEQLYQMEDLTRLKLSEYLRNLFNGAVASSSLPAHKIRIELDVEELPLSLDHAIPFGLLVNELLCNSLKHGLADAKQGRIRIGLHRTQDGVRLEIQDDGKGLPEGFNATQSSSMGLKLAASLAHQLGGELEFSPGNGGCHIAADLSRL